MNIIKYLIVFSIVVTLGCIKKEKSVPAKSDLKFEIIEALNQGNSDKALELSLKGQREQANDFEYYYFQAQAYSQKAQVDVYSLYPLMKMKIFDVAVTEWKKQEEFDKKRKQQFQTNLIGSEESDNNSNDLENIRRKIIDTKLEDFPIEIVSTELLSFPEGYYCQYSFKIKSPLFVYDEVIDFWTSGNKNSEDKCEKTLHLNEDSYQFTNMRQLAKTEAMQLIDLKITRTKQRRNEERYAKALFALFDSIPILKEAPTLKAENAEFAITALSKLDIILGQSNMNQRLKENTIQQIRLLSSYLIIGSYKNTTNFDNVSEVGDLICEVDPKSVVEHYRYFLYGTKYFFKAMRNSDLAKKYWDDYLKYFNLLNTAPEEISIEHNEKYIREIKDFKNNRGC